MHAASARAEGRLSQWLRRAPPWVFVLYAVAASFTTYFRATEVFTIYVADALGCTGSVGVQLYRDLAEREMSRLGFFHAFSYALSLGAVALLALSLGYFWVKTKRAIG